MNAPRGTTACGAVIVLLLLVALAGCTGLSGRLEGLPPSGQYAFLDHQVIYTGTLVSGTCPAPAIDVSPYIFDADSKTLAGIVPFEINESLLVVYGESTTLTGAYGRGGYGELSGAYALPYKNGNLTVDGFTKDGTMYLTYNNKSIALTPGMQWMDFSSGTETTRACTVNRTVTDVITYYGNYPQAGIARTRLA
jgi:predicted small lipoprotein YifL